MSGRSDPSLDEDPASTQLWPDTEIPRGFYCVGCLAKFPTVRLHDDHQREGPCVDLEYFFSGDGLQPPSAGSYNGCEAALQPPEAWSASPYHPAPPTFANTPVIATGSLNEISATYQIPGTTSEEFSPQTITGYEALNQFSLSGNNVEIQSPETLRNSQSEGDNSPSPYYVATDRESMSDIDLSAQPPRTFGNDLFDPGLPPVANYETLSSGFVNFNDLLPQPLTAASNSTFQSGLLSHLPLGPAGKSSSSVSGVTHGTPAAEVTNHKSKVNLHQCPVPSCGKRFSRRWFLQNHIRSHESYSQRPFRCNVYGCRSGGLRTQTDLERHTQSKHASKRPG